MSTHNEFAKSPMVATGFDLGDAPEPEPIPKRWRDKYGTFRVPLSERPFVGWDGEGTAQRAGSKDKTQRYSLFGCTAEGWKPLIAEQLSTYEILCYLGKAARELRYSIHVGFGFNYDVDMILRDIPDDDLKTLKLDRFSGDDIPSLVWCGFQITYIPRKMFTVREIETGATITIFETVAFFASSLMVAARKYIPETHSLYSTLEFVKAGKDSRDVFTFEEMESLILPYWEAEGALFVSMMETLRTSTEAAGFNMRSWHGPGAIASALFSEHGSAQHIRQSRNRLPLKVSDALARAFFGGHIENYCCGTVFPGPVYTADIVSAYPAAMARLPMLKGGRWIRRNPDTVTVLNPWALYRVRFDLLEYLSHDLTPEPFPLPVRSFNGHIAYPARGQGWYFGCELDAAMAWKSDRYPIDFRSHATILEVYEYVNGTDALAFPWVAEVFEKRAEAKRLGNPAQLAYKLGLNSLYGKLAQTTGWRSSKTGGPHRLPQFYHPYYAAAITAWCRAQLMHAMVKTGLSHIISVETDGIYSARPIPVTESKSLGGWELSEYDAITYVQSGLYVIHKNGEMHTRTRGFRARDLKAERIMETSETFDLMRVSQRFYGSMTFVGKPEHHTWFDVTRTIKWGGDPKGKRYHNVSNCSTCNGFGGHYGYHRNSLGLDGWGNPERLSFKRFLPWETVNDYERKPLPEWDIRSIEAYGEPDD